MTTHDLRFTDVVVKAVPLVRPRRARPRVARPPAAGPVRAGPRPAAAVGRPGRRPADRDHDPPARPAPRQRPARRGRARRRRRALDQLHSAVPADGDRLGLVDFEDSGRSDRATEWAALVEHQAARCAPDAGWQPLLGAVADQGRPRAARRYYGCLWLALMLPGARGYYRNPPAVRRAQAERLVGLL